MQSLDTLAARLPDCPAFDWLPGMLAILPASAGGGALRVTEQSEAIPAGAFPDLSDGATRGALLDLARAAYLDHTLSPYRTSAAWEIYCEAPEPETLRASASETPEAFEHTEEGGAIALALLSAPSLSAARLVAARLAFPESEGEG